MIVLLLIQRNVGGHIYVFYISDNQLGICRRTSNGLNFRYGLHSHLRSQGVDTDWVWWGTEQIRANAALYCMGLLPNSVASCWAYKVLQILVVGEGCLGSSFGPDATLVTLSTTDCRVAGHVGHR